MNKYCTLNRPASFKDINPQQSCHNCVWNTDDGEEAIVCEKHKYEEICDPREHVCDDWE